MKTGPYAGLKCFNGLIKNAFSRTVAYQILGDEEKDDIFVSARDSHLICRPKWVDQNRCITALASAIADNVDIFDITSYEKFAAKLFAMQTFIETHEGDNINDDAERYESETTASGDVTIEHFEAGMVRKFRAGSGADIKAFEQARPSPNIMQFRRELMRGTFSALRWPIEFAYDSSTLNGTAVRLVGGKAQRTVKYWQSAIGPAASKAVKWALLGFIGNGTLKPNKEWYRWGFRMPPRMSVDIGREASSAREDNMMALRSAQDIYDEQNLEWREEFDQCMDEAKYLLDGCEQRGIPVELVRYLKTLRPAAETQQQQDPNANHK